MVRIYREQIFWLGVLILAIFLLILVREILFPFILGIFLTYLTLPTVKLLEKRKVPRSIAIALVYIGVGIVIWASAVFLIPLLVQDLNSLLLNLQVQTERLDGLARYLTLRYQRLNLPMPVRSSLDQGLQASRQFLQELITRAINLLIQLVSKGFYLILAPVIAYYLTRDIELIKKTVVQTFPLSWQGEILGIGREVNSALSGFVRGQLLICLFVGLGLTFGLFLLGVPYSLVIGLVAGITNIIPYFGPVVGALPAVLAAATISATHILYVLLLFVVVNQFEAVILAPLILEERVGLHPIIVIFAVLSGGALFGIIGTLIAVPIAAIIKVLFLYCRSKYAPIK